MLQVRRYATSSAWRDRRFAGIVPPMSATETVWLVGGALGAIALGFITVSIYFGEKMADQTQATVGRIGIALLCLTISFGCIVYALTNVVYNPYESDYVRVTRYQGREIGRASVSSDSLLEQQRVYRTLCAPLAAVAAVGFLGCTVIRRRAGLLAAAVATALVITIPVAFVITRNVGDAALPELLRPVAAAQLGGSLLVFAVLRALIRPSEA